MFNTFVWQLYTESERGRRALGHLSSFSNVLHDSIFLTPLFGMFFDDLATGYPATDPESAGLVCAVRDFAAENRVESLEQATTLFNGLPSSKLTFRFPGETEATPFTFEDLTDNIQLVSVGFHLAYPEYFIPYGFTNLFDFLERIGKLFNFALPPVPGKRDLEGRARYYGLLNHAFHEFRHLYGLSTAEMCAFLYDFAPRFLTEDKDELPEPAKAWPIVAGAYFESDHDWLAQADSESQSSFNGHPEMRRGDVLLVYGVSRYKQQSFISHIGRALSDGFRDPFCYYYDTVWLGKLVPVIPVHFKELRAYPLLAQSVHIRTHMKGPGSGAFTLEEYEAILALMAKKGQDVTRLPKPRTIAFLPSTELSNERDVETELVEPLLLRLGYSEKDWLRQMRLRMGRGERIYPDYVFGVNTTRGDERADMVLEAKFTIGSERALHETYLQAVSYAYRLRAKAVLLAAREGLWLFGQKRESFGLERFTFYSWDALQHPDTLFQLKKGLVKPRR